MMSNVIISSTYITGVKYHHTKFVCNYVHIQYDEYDDTSTTTSGVLPPLSVCDYRNYGQLHIGWHRILRLFLKTFSLVPGVPGFSWDL